VNRKNSSGATRQIEVYLRELTAAARILPRERRRELIEDVRSHIEVTLTESGREDTEAVRAVLDALGEPGEIVAAAVPDDAGTVRLSRGITALEITAILLLLFGAAVAGVGWLVGVLLLWASPRWTRGDKLLGTLVLPGGVLLPIVLAAGLASGSPIAPLALLLVGVTAPALTALRLLQRARAASVLDGGARWSAGVWAVGAVVLAIPMVGTVFFMAASSSPGSATPVTVNGTVTPTHSPS